MACFPYGDGTIAPATPGSGNVGRVLRSGRWPVTAVSVVRVPGHAHFRDTERPSQRIMQLIQDGKGLEVEVDSPFR